MVHQLRKSYSLTDLGHDENDYGATITEHRAITSDPGKVDTAKYFSDTFFIENIPKKWDWPKKMPITKNPQFYSK